MKIKGVITMKKNDQTPISLQDVIAQKNHFDKYALEYELSINKRKYDFEFNLIGKHIDFKKIHRLLDLATGTGKIAFKIFDYSSDIHIVGIDSSPKMIEIATKKSKELGVKNVKFEMGNIESLKYRKNFFDIVTIGYALHHVPNIKRQKVLKEAGRVLKTDGFIIIFEVGPKHFKEVLERYYSVEDSYNNRLSMDKIEEILKNNNFVPLYSYTRRELLKLSKKYISDYILIQGMISSNGKKYDNFVHQLDDKMLVTNERILCIASKNSERVDEIVN